MCTYKIVYGGQNLIYCYICVQLNSPTEDGKNQPRTIDDYPPHTIDDSFDIDGSNGASVDVLVDKKTVHFTPGPSVKI